MADLAAVSAESKVGATCPPVNPTGRSLLDHPDTWRSHQRLPLDMANFVIDGERWHSAATWVWRTHAQR